MNFNNKNTQIYRIEGFSMKRLPNPHDLVTTSDPDLTKIRVNKTVNEDANK